MKKSYEAIFIGCGAIGSAARYRPFRDAGVPVLGIERFRLGHERGA